MKQEILNLLKKLENYSFILGVIDDSQKRKSKSGEITNSELLMIHELGSPLKKIPPRPILEWTINHKKIQELLDDLIETCIILCLEGKDNEIDVEFERTALRIETFIRRSLQRGDNELKPLSLQTIKRKKSNLPLIDTGQLMKSIVCRVVKK